MHDVLTPDQIQAAVRQAIAGAGVESITNLSTQVESASYELHLNDRIEVTLKVYIGPQADSNLEQETRLLGLLTSETGVPTPRVLHKAGELAGRPLAWAMFTRIPGYALSWAADLLDNWESETIGYESGRYLSHIHQMALDEFGALFTRGPHNHPREKSHLLAQVDEWLASCIENALLPQEAATAFRQHLLQTNLLDRRRACLIHGDLRPDRIIVEKGGTGYHVAGIVGFGQARGGSPEFDIAALFSWPVAQTPTFQKGFLDGYAESGELPPRFWERLALYEAIFCLAELTSNRDQGDTGLALDCEKRFVDYTNQLPDPL